MPVDLTIKKNQKQNHFTFPEMLSLLKVAMVGNLYSILLGCFFVSMVLVNSTYGLTSLQLGDSTGSAGGVVNVPLLLSTSDVVSGAQIDLYTDPNVAVIASVSGSDAGANHIVA
ncbi:MAG: hypothetical protein O3C20_20950 [Verrucomicrobia bacterium]|nr:hypothetical protein [Verrucomicrobiota bacterium]